MLKAILAKTGSIIGALLLTAASWFSPTVTAPVVPQTQTVVSVPIVTVGVAEQEGLVTANQMKFAAQNGKFGAAGVIPLTSAFFETYLVSPIGTSDTSFTLASNLTTAGIALKNGYYSFVLDQGTPQQEVVEGTLSGTVVSGVIRGIDPQNPDATDSALIFTHSRAADVKITDYSFIGHVSNILNGGDTFPNVLQYAPSVTNAIIGASGQNIADQAYVASTSFAGTVNGNATTKGIYQEATTSTIASGTTVGSTGADLTLTQNTASTTCGKAYNVIETNASGSLDTTCLNSGASYTVGGISSASTTLTGTTTIAGINVTSTSFSKFGGTGVNGALSLSGTQTSTINLSNASVLIENYTSISITGSSTLSFSNPATNGSIVVLKSQGNCTLTSSAASGTIVVSNLGAAASNYGNGLIAGPNVGVIMTGTFGISGPSTENVDTSFGGQGKHIASSSASAYAVFAGAGGISGTGNTASGGQGGGGLLIECGGSLNFTGTINANGNNGLAGSGNANLAPTWCSGAGGGSNTDGGGGSCSGTENSFTSTLGGGGGGAGSTVILYNGALVANSGTINVTGGSGGTGTGSAGGAGGTGFSFVGQNTEY